MAGLVVAVHEPGDDERLRLRARLREAALDEEDVEPLLHGAGRAALPRSQSTVRLPAVDDVPEALAAGTARLDPPEELALRRRLAREHAGRGAAGAPRRSSPSSGWWRSSHSRYLLYGRTRPPSAKIVRNASGIASTGRVACP